MKPNSESSFDEDFKKQALEVIEIFEVSIEFIGFPQNEMEKLNSFYDEKFSDDEEELKKRIMSVHSDFFAEANFKDRDAHKNKQLSERLLKELNEIRKQLVVTSK